MPPECTLEDYTRLVIGILSNDENLIYRYDVAGTPFEPYATDDLGLLVSAQESGKGWLRASLRPLLEHGAALQTLKAQADAEDRRTAAMDAARTDLRAAMHALTPEQTVGAQRLLGERTTFTDAEGRYRFDDVASGSHRLRLEDPSRRWLVVPVEVEASTALHQTVSVDVQVSGPLRRSYLPLVMRW